MIKARIGLIAIALVNALLGAGAASAQDRSVEEILGFINASIRDRPVTTRHFHDDSLSNTCTWPVSIELERFGFLTINSWQTCSPQIEFRSTQRLNIGDIVVDSIRVIHHPERKDGDGAFYLIRAAHATLWLDCKPEFSECLTLKIRSEHVNLDGQGAGASFMVRMSGALAARLSRALRALIEAALKDPRYRPY